MRFEVLTAVEVFGIQGSNALQIEAVCSSKNADIYVHVYTTLQPRRPTSMPLLQDQWSASSEMKPLSVSNSPSWVNMWRAGEEE
jgi:hypothetical protein